MSMDGVDDTEVAEARIRPNLVYPLGDPPEAGVTREIAPGVHWIRMPLPFALKWINLWLLEDGDGWTIIDTGVAMEQSREYWRKIFDETLGGKPVTRVICTHMHPDHVGLAGWICRKFDASLWMSRLEYITCRVLVADTGREAPEEGVAFYRAAGWDEDLIDSYKIRFGGFGKAVSRVPDAYKRMADGDIVEIGGRPWRVITGNGHCPEHVCLWQEELKLFISGDQVLPRISSNVSVFPTEPDGDPLADWISSCKKLLDVMPNDVLVLPSHNEPFIGLHERLHSLIDGHERTLKRILSRLNEPKRAIDLFGAMFARKIGSDVIGMATGEAIAHVNCLVGRGLARRVTDEQGITRYVAA
ncbi:MBL fold metallo-hydrolase [Terricaulis silvestris]|uniref:Hydroxyacylglutathione hydrolase n=1 Tax=Terricaulis silvestris TaxID=2686094 RepID=A0A6I6MSB4_9CAUL|nr:MBL fold metallo-hydrolase [Terricaulis silvestris]QGZ94562.1 hydroxyacylglutathione hydrolase [Terricaulis silvestris]